MSSKTGFDGLSLRLLPVVAALALPLTGLSKDEIQTYRIPKDPARAKSPAASSGAPVSAGKPLTWTVPTGWQESPSSGVRVGLFTIPGKDGKAGAQLTIMPFGGMVGGELANINRWRAEVGLAPIDEAAVTSSPVQVGTEPAKLYEVVGEKEETLVAWLYRNDTSWFFKLRGDKDTVAENKATLVEFLKSVRFVAEPSLDAANAVADTPMANPHQAGMPAGHPDMDMGNMPAGHPQIETKSMPAGHPPVGTLDSNAASAVQLPNLPVWQVPASWKEVPPGRMVHKSYVAGDDKTKAIITISSFPGDVGGLLANVNRWRGQLKLEPIAEADLSKYTKDLETKNGKATQVQMDSENVRLIGIILPHGKDTWFYKMVGDASVVDQEKQNLISLVQTAQYP